MNKLLLCTGFLAVYIASADVTVFNSSSAPINGTITVNGAYQPFGVIQPGKSSVVTAPAGAAVTAFSAWNTYAAPITSSTPVHTVEYHGGSDLRVSSAVPTTVTVINSSKAPINGTITVNGASVLFGVVQPGGSSIVTTPFNAQITAFSAWNTYAAPITSATPVHTIEYHGGSNLSVSSAITPVAKPVVVSAPQVSVPQKAPVKPAGTRVIPSKKTPVKPVPKKNVPPKKAPVKPVVKAHALKKLDRLFCTCDNGFSFNAAVEAGDSSTHSAYCTKECGAQNFTSNNFKVFKNELSGFKPGEHLVTTWVPSVKNWGCDDASRRKYLEKYKTFNSTRNFVCRSWKNKKYTEYEYWIKGDSLANPKDILAYTCNDGHTEYHVGNSKNIVGEKENHRALCKHHKGPHGAVRRVGPSPNRAPFFYGNEVVKNKEGVWERAHLDICVCDLPKGDHCFFASIRGEIKGNSTYCKKRCGGVFNKDLAPPDLAPAGVGRYKQLYSTESGWKAGTLLQCTCKNGDTLMYSLLQNTNEVYNTLCYSACTYCKNPQSCKVLFKDRTILNQPDPPGSLALAGITKVHIDPVTKKIVPNLDVIQCNCKLQGTYFVVGDGKKVAETNAMCSGLCGAENWSDTQSNPNKPAPVVAMVGDAPVGVNKDHCVLPDPGSGRWKPIFDVVQCACQDHSTFAKAGSRFTKQANKEYCAKNCFNDIADVSVATHPGTAPFDATDGERLRHDATKGGWIKNPDVIACSCANGDVMNFVAWSADPTANNQKCTEMCAPHKGFAANKYAVIPTAAPDGASLGSEVRLLANGTYVRAGTLDVLKCTCEHSAVFTIVGDGNNPSEANDLCRLKCKPVYGWEENSLNNQPVLHPEIVWKAAPPNAYKGDVVWEHYNGTWLTAPSDVVECPCLGGKSRSIVRISAQANRADDAGKDDLCYWACDRKWESGKKHFLVHKHGAPPGIAPDSDTDLQPCLYYSNWCPTNTISS